MTSDNGWESTAFGNTDPMLISQLEEENQRLWALLKEALNLLRDGAKALEEDGGGE